MPSHDDFPTLHGKAKPFKNNRDVRPKATASKNIQAIDLNHSTAPELELLPGIGPILAKRIVEHRLLIKGFQDVKELDQVKGIGNKKLQTLMPLLKVTPRVVARK